MKTMAEEEAKQQPQEKPEGGDQYLREGRKAESLLRVAPMGLCLAAMVIMIKNAQENDFGAVSYADLSAFKYLVYANGACAAYSLLSAFYVAMPRPMTLARSWAVFFFDQLLTFVILAAGSVSSEIVYLAYNGNESVTWSKECGVFDSFCRRATTSVEITFGSVACFMVLSLISSYRLFSSYESPIPFLSSKDLEIAAFPC
ncbi:CASP-like protein 2A1 [Canna indica]|uniref:CASP-like protein n=1 Tax=Canna indica TaxID=4628 RepID=A0AAQ3KGR1_9LILI|nr:CASP-like protein 2A1 [Canna indica]